MEKFADFASLFKLKALQSMLDSIKQRTGIIDCGEEDIDSNRKVWDALEEKGLKNAIYLMCGKNV